VSGSTWTEEDLKILDDAIKKGVKIVKYTDKEVTYRSLDEMLKIRQLICKQLGLTNRSSTRLLAQHSKGLC
jgi:thiamine monophosphate synthase